MKLFQKQTTISKPKTNNKMKATIHDEKTRKEVIAAFDNSLGINTTSTRNDNDYNELTKEDLDELLPSNKGQNIENKINPKFEELKNPLSIIEHIKELKETIKKPSHKIGLFNVKTANEWLEEAKHLPIPKMLFSELWHEHEICILFADTNLGKSILAVQIGNSISSGKQIMGFKLEADKQKVLYFDFELSAKQFEARYSTKNFIGQSFETHYSFDTNFKRIEINPDVEIPNKVKATVDSVCAACHVSGIANAPKYGDTAAWDARMARGLDAVTASAIAGIGAMPARGGSSLNDEEMGLAVQYMLTK